MLARANLAWLLFTTVAYTADYRIEANIRYAQHPETVLDILQARAPALKNRPAVVVVHGGGWVQGTKEDAVQRFCLPFLDRGLVVANVDYRLARAAPAPAAVEDVLAAVAWLRERTPEYKIDPNQILIAGYSAGGELALMAAMTTEAAGFGRVTKIAAVLNFYGISDVADQVSGPNQRDYAQTWIPEQPHRLDLASRVSPLTYVRKGLPPVLSIHGDADDVVPYAQSQRLTRELKAVGVDTELITVPGGKHGFEPAEMDKLWPQVFKWLKKRKISI